MAAPHGRPEFNALKVKLKKNVLMKCYFATDATSEHKCLSLAMAMLHFKDFQRQK